MIKLKVNLSDEDQGAKYSREFLLVDGDLNISKDDARLKSYVDRAISDFKGVASLVSITLKMDW